MKRLKLVCNSPRCLPCGAVFVEAQAEMESVSVQGSSDEGYASANLWPRWCEQELDLNLCKPLIGQSSVIAKPSLS